MKITVEQKTGWKDALRCARTTVWRKDLDKEPSDSFKKQLVISEHSPLREVMFSISIEGLESWVATHFVRHNIGVTWYVSTQRDDRVDGDKPRSEKSQCELVNIRGSANAQAMINISKLRLCHCASIETVQAWRGVIRELKKIDPIIASACVPNCVYRGICAEGDEAEAKCKYTFKSRLNMRTKYVKYFNTHEN